MRDFNDKDRTKKASRIQISENPSNLPPETIARLESEVRTSLKDGYLPCPVAWKIAGDNGVPKIAVGAVMDKLGVRVTDCQLGFFKVESAHYAGNSAQEVSPEIAAGLRELDSSGALTCLSTFELAHRLKSAPMKISEAANILGLKRRACQLGCF
jgi:hypothetical protein